MIHKSRYALRNLNHVIDRQNSGWPRLLTANSHKVLQDKPRATLIWLSEHRHDWTARVDPTSVRPMTTCRSRDTGLPKHKVLGDWSYKVHRPRLIPTLYYQCTGGNCEYCFCVIFLIKIVLCQQSHQTTIPYHRVKFCNVTDWPRWQKFENKYDILLI